MKVRVTVFFSAGDQTALSLVLILWGSGRQYTGPRSSLWAGRHSPGYLQLAVDVESRNDDGTLLGYRHCLWN